MTKIHYIIFLITFVFSFYAVAESYKDNPDFIDSGTIVCKSNKVSGTILEEDGDDQYDLCSKKYIYYGTQYITFQNQELGKEEARVMLDYIAAKIDWSSYDIGFPYAKTDSLSIAPEDGEKIVAEIIIPIEETIFILNEVNNSKHFPFKSKIIMDERPELESADKESKSLEPGKLSLFPEQTGVLCTHILSIRFCVKYEPIPIPAY